MTRIQKITIAAAVLSTAIFVVFFFTVYRKIDQTGPDISMDTDTISAGIQSSSDELLDGVTATDAEDGDVSDTLMVESQHYLEHNLCSMVIAASDRSHNVTKAVRNVYYDDYYSPRFTILNSLRFPVGTDTKTVLESFTAEDCMDGDITPRIKLNATDADNDTAGIYEYSVQVTNSIGDTSELPVSIEYYTDTYAERIYYPQIYLSDYLVYVKAGGSITPKMYLDHLKLGNNYYVFSASGGNKEIDGSVDENFTTLTEDGEKISGAIHLSAIKMSSDIDMDTPGTYTVTFSCTTTDGYIGSVQMIVVVEEA